MINFKSPKKYTIPLNIFVFNLCRLFPFRSKYIWIFGAWEGRKFDDNSKYFIDYVRLHNPVIRSIWMTSNEQTYYLLKKKGYEVYLNNSLKGKWIQLRAGVAVYTNGLVDFGYIPLVGGSKVVALWHGMSFKRIYNGTYSGMSLFVKKCLDRLFSWTYRNITTVTSEYGAQWVDEMFTLNKDKIYITGQPRNDAFKGLNKEVVLSNTKIDPTKRLLIYMPTYRKSSLCQNAMTEIVKELYNSDKFSQSLKVMNSVFVVKLHPLTPHISLVNRDDFFILDYAAVKNNQDLLGVADCLITDYSSCFIDYALLNRPIVFYTPDEESFLKYSEQLDNVYFNIKKLNYASNPDELADKIQSTSSEVALATNSIYEDGSIRGTCYSENVYKVICDEIGLQSK